MPRAKTHFEQIPVELVKKIAQEESETQEVRDNVILRIPVKTTEPHAGKVRWRCRTGI